MNSVDILRIRRKHEKLWQYANDMKPLPHTINAKFWATRGTGIWSKLSHELNDILGGQIACEIRNNEVSFGFVCALAVELGIPEAKIRLRIEMEKENARHQT